MAEIVSLGAGATYSSATGVYSVPTANVRRDIDYENDDVEDFGECKIACCLGVTAIPAAVNEETGEGAEGLLVPGCGGEVGHVVAAWDTRAADVVGQMGPGDSCLHGTHTDSTKRTKFFAKEDLAAILVGNDMVLTMDRDGEAITISAWGNVFQMTPDSVVISQGGVDGSPVAWIEIKKGSVSIIGSTTVGGTTALPLVQATGLVAALDVLAGAMTSIGAVPVTGNALATALATLSASVAVAATKQIVGA